MTTPQNTVLTLATALVIGCKIKEIFVFKFYLIINILLLNAMNSSIRKVDVRNNFWIPQMASLVVVLLDLMN